MNCPKCGDELFYSSSTQQEFKCLTLVLKDGKTFEGGNCAKRQRDQLADRVKELEAVRELALDTLKMVASNIRNELVSREIAGRSANQWPDVLNGCVSEGGVESAIEALENVKGRQ